MKILSVVGLHENNVASILEQGFTPKICLHLTSIEFIA